jgi:hypothetical protein
MTLAVLRLFLSSSFFLVMATLISSGPSKPQLKEKEREYELENNDNPAVFFINPKHNNS